MGCGSSFPDVQARLADNVIRLRHEAGLSQLQLAEKAGFALLFIKRLEACREDPLVSEIERLADVFEVSPAVMLSSHSSKQFDAQQ